LVNEDTVRTARETAPHSVDWPNWTNAPGFEKDVFTYARVLFKSRPGRPSWLGWINEFSENRAYPLAINIVFYLMTHEPAPWARLTRPFSARSNFAHFPIGAGPGNLA
jgi:hypothetical protein